MSRGRYTLQGGFWGLIADVPTSGTPPFTILRSNRFLIESWPLPAEGWVLETTNHQSQVSAPWPQIPPPNQTNGANLEFTEPIPVRNKFYRLHKP